MEFEAVALSLESEAEFRLSISDRDAEQIETIGSPHDYLVGHGK